MRKLLLTLLLLPFAAAAQTAIPIQNHSFETNVGITGNGYEYGNVPSWTLSSGAAAGVQALSTAYFTSYPDGTQNLFVNSGNVTQDLGVTAQINTTYTLTFYVGHRLDNQNTTATAQLFIGSTSLCTMSVDESTLTAGVFTAETLTCQTGATVPSGDLIIWLGTAGTQANFDNLSLTSAPNIQHQVALAWQDKVNPAGTTYNVMRATAPCSSYAQLANVSALAYTDTTIVQGATYCYAIQAVVNGQTSGFPLSITVNVQ